jgi:ribosomal protein S18 acetylase RimI-like enzyme
MKRRHGLHIIHLHDKETIEAFLRRDPILHMFALGDLDDFYWPHTGWYALENDGEIRQLILTYKDAPQLVLMALTCERVEEMRELLRSILHLLPQRMFVHLSEGLAEVMAAAYRLHSQGKFLRMALNNLERVSAVDTSAVVQLARADLPGIEQLLQKSFPGSAFNPRMLQTGQYFGVERNGILAGIAGVHVWSPTYRVAVLGNVATHPEYRRQGIATAVTARLCQSLMRTVDHIGLMVHENNMNAISTYSRLGFVQHSAAEVYELEMKSGGRVT